MGSVVEWRWLRIKINEQEVEFTQTEQQRQNRLRRKMGRASGTMTKDPTCVSLEFQKERKRVALEEYLKK